MAFSRLALVDGAARRGRVAFRGLRHAVRRVALQEVVAPLAGGADAGSLRREELAAERKRVTAGFQREGRHERFVVHPNLSDEPRPCFMYARCR